MRVFCFGRFEACPALASGFGLSGFCELRCLQLSGLTSHTGEDSQGIGASRKDHISIPSYPEFVGLAIGEDKLHLPLDCLDPMPLALAGYPRIQSPAFFNARWVPVVVLCYHTTTT